MGPKNGCSYADVAMGEITHKAKHCGPIKSSQWWRYMYRDEIFDLWQQGLAPLNSFPEYINSLYPTIKFEMVYSESKLYVVDVTLHLVNGFIQTDVYSKPTDSHLYTCIFLHPVPTQSMFSKQSRLESPQDCVETVVLRTFFLIKGWRSTKAT